MLRSSVAIQGLGKTIQTISLITYLIEKKQENGPYLVLVPLSTLTNWTSEFKLWAPGVKVLILKGDKNSRKALADQVKRVDFQVLLTTYEYVIKEANALGRIRWHHMIIDEGHRMKNAQSKLAKTLNEKYSTKFRIILTGTPLQVRWMICAFRARYQFLFIARTIFPNCGRCSISYSPKYSILRSRLTNGSMRLSLGPGQRLLK